MKKIDKLHINCVKVKEYYCTYDLIDNSIVLRFIKEGIEVYRLWHIETEFIKGWTEAVSKLTDNDFATRLAERMVSNHEKGFKEI